MLLLVETLTSETRSCFCGDDYCVKTTVNIARNPHLPRKINSTLESNLKKLWFGVNSFCCKCCREKGSFCGIKDVMNPFLCLRASYHLIIGDNRQVCHKAILCDHVFRVRTPVKHNRSKEQQSNKSDHVFSGVMGFFL